MIRAEGRRRVTSEREGMRRRARFALECLEDRALLATVAPLNVVEPASLEVRPAGVSTFPYWPNWWKSGGGIAVTNPTPDPTALTPAQVGRAYSLETGPYVGLGTTIALVLPYHDASIVNDLAIFDQTYGLPSANLTIVNQTGSTSNLPGSNTAWSLERAMDVEWAHAAAPGAKLVLVEANSASIADLSTAVATAARMANVVSMSWGGSEFSSETTFDTSAYFANPNVTFVAAAGDDGGVNGPSWPAVSPYVLAVGGTSLTLQDSSGTYGGETGWSLAGGVGGSGGVSSVESMPTYQLQAVGSNYASGRVVPDVSMVADPATGLSVYSSVLYAGQSGWFKSGGTSLGAPIWAGIIASIDAHRFRASQPPLSSTQTLSLLYGFYGTNGPNSSSYASVFHDITTGANYVDHAARGFDAVTGLGTPIVSKLVDLATNFAWTAPSPMPGFSGPASRMYAFVLPYQLTVDARPGGVGDAGRLPVAPHVASETSVVGAPGYLLALQEMAELAAPGTQVSPASSVGRARPAQEAAAVLTRLMLARYEVESSIDARFETTMQASLLTGTPSQEGTDLYEAPSSATDVASTGPLGDWGVPTPPLMDVAAIDAATPAPGSTPRVEASAGAAAGLALALWALSGEPEGDSRRSSRRPRRVVTRENPRDA